MSFLKGYIQLGARLLAKPYLSGSLLQMSTTSKCLAAKVTQPAPDFSAQAVSNGQFKEISLSDFRGKYLVMFFYPLDFTFVCPTEIIAYSDKISEFNAVGCDVVGISTDSHFSHLAWINTPRKEGGLGGLNYPLLADFNKTISQDYGVLLEKEGIALRGLFIIDKNGIIRHMSINDLPVGRSVDETLRLVKAFQFVEQYGEEQGHDEVATLRSNSWSVMELDVAALDCTYPATPGSSGTVWRNLSKLCLKESTDDTPLIFWMLSGKELKSRFPRFIVCPANWLPDSPTIKPDPKGSKEYFSKVN